MKTHESYLIMFLLLVLLEVNMGPLQSQTIRKSDGLRLITSSQYVQEGWVGKAHSEIRRRGIQLNATILTPGATNLGDKIDINLFGEQLYTATLSRVVVDVNNVLSMSGRIDGTEWGFFYLSYKNGITLAIVKVVEKQEKYIITYDRSAGVHFLTEIDPRLIKLWECAPPLIPQK